MVKILLTFLKKSHLFDISKHNNVKQQQGVNMGKQNCIENYLYNYAISQPDKIAVIVKGKSYKYKELFDLSLSYAKHLKEAGVCKGDVVILKARQAIEFVVCYFAIHLANAVVSSLEKSCPVSTVESIANQLSAKAIIDDEVDNPNFIKLRYSEVMDYANQKSTFDFEFPEPNDSSDILFTTGTTGKSKGVELSHRNLVATAENLIFGCQYSKDIVLISPGPLNHANAIRKLYTTIVNGSTIIILDGLSSIDDFYDALNYKCEKVACCLVPAFIRIIFQNSETDLGKYADKIDFIESASSPLPEADKDRLCELLPNTRLYNNYGSSESASSCIYDYHKYRGLKNCIGKPMPNSEIIIVDKDKNPIKSSANNLGYISCKGDVNMKGYKNEKELTESIMQNGIIYSQDLGYIDEEGFVYIIGRDSDVINVGGLKIAPAEVESVVLSMPGIMDCILIEDSNELIGKTIKLLYVANEEINASKFVKFLRHSLEMYKIPTKYEKVDKIQRLYNGKLDRKFYKKG